MGSVGQFRRKWKCGVAGRQVTIIPLATDKLAYIYKNYDFDDDEMNIIIDLNLSNFSINVSFSFLSFLFHHLILHTIITMGDN